VPPPSAKGHAQAMASERGGRREASTRTVLESIRAHVLGVSERSKAMAELGEQTAVNRRDSSVSRERSGSGADRIAQTHQRKRSGLNEKRLQMHPKEYSSRRSGARAAMGTEYELAQDRGKNECPVAVHHRDRWTRHSFHSRPFQNTKMRCR